MLCNEHGHISMGAKDVSGPRAHLPRGKWYAFLPKSIDLGPPARIKVDAYAGKYYSYFTTEETGAQRA